MPNPLVVFVENLLLVPTEPSIVTYAKLWSHANCNSINTTTYEAMVNEEDASTWYCRKCINADATPFSDSNAETFTLLMQGMNPNSLSDFHLEDPQLLTNDINELKLNENCNDSSAYYSLSELNSVKTKSNSVNLFHLNIASLGYHFETFQSILSACRIKFDFIGISETKIRQGTLAIQNTKLENYN